MEKQKILFYLLKWVALVILSYLTLKENHSGIIIYLLIGYVCAILIWEGIRDFGIRDNDQG